MIVLAGAGVGGGSLVYANTLYVPGEGYFKDPHWAHITDWADELLPFYDQAQRMLGVVKNPTMTSADVAFKAVADEMGVGHTFKMTPVGVYFGESPGVTVPGSLLRRRRTRAHRLHRVRRVHDRLPAQRQEHPRRRTTSAWPRARARWSTR